MKASHYILIIILLSLGSCTSSLYTGAEYDDLYYLASDKPVVKANPATDDRFVEGSLSSQDYYDNIYAADTLISEQYYDAVDYDDDVIINNNSYSGAYDYYDNYSYTGRLRMFHGNYFDPYWRDPFYYSYGGYPSFGLGYGYGGFPYYSYRPYYMDPFNRYGGFYGDYYNSYYSGYYGGYGSYYSSYYGAYGYYGGSYIRGDVKNSVAYGRRERPSSLSSKWNSNVSGAASSRRDQSLGTGRTYPGTQSATGSSRRTPSTLNNSPTVNPVTRSSIQDQTKGTNIRTNTATQRNSANVRPDYNSANRTYTPSYSTPRMSTRPSYNNSRVVEGASVNNLNRSGATINNSRINSNSGNVRTPVNQSSIRSQGNSSRIMTPGNSVQRRAITPSNNSVRYSVPSRSSVSTSSRSFNNSSSSGSRSSYSGSSSSSVSRSSVSSGSSSGSSGSSSSSSGSSSGGRRR